MSTRPDVTGPSLPDPGRSPAHARVRRQLEGDTAVHGLGIEFIDIAEGRVTLRIPIEERMLNGIGVAHGGYLFAVADTAFAYAGTAAGRPTATHMAETTFVAPVRDTSYLEAEARIVHQYGRNVVSDVVVRNDSGELVGLMRGHGVIVKNASG